MGSRVAVSTIVSLLTLAVAGPGPALAGTADRPPGPGHGGPGKSAPGKGKPGNARLADETRAEVQAVLATGTPATGVLRRDGRRSEAAGGGVAERETQRPYDPRDRFYAGSTTKTFVATTVLRLAERGTVDLDDPVERWLPGLVPNGAAITIRLLLNQRSGLAEFTDDPAAAAPAEQDPDHRFSLEELAAVALAKPPVAAPGAGFHYSNTNYVLAGLIIERATGRPWTEVVTAQTIDRLRLRDTSFGTVRVEPEPFLHGYLPAGEGEGEELVQATGLVSPTFTGSAGQLVSTLDDLARFYGALLGGHLLKRSSLAEMQDAVPVEGAEGFRYGLGLFELQTACGPAWGHDGELFGTSTLALSSADGRRQVITVANRGLPTPEVSAPRTALFEKTFCTDRRSAPPRA